MNNTTKFFGKKQPEIIWQEILARVEEDHERYDNGIVSEKDKSFALKDRNHPLSKWLENNNIGYSPEEFPEHWIFKFSDVMPKECRHLFDNYRQEKVFDESIATVLDRYKIEYVNRIDGMIAEKNRVEAENALRDVMDEYKDLLKKKQADAQEVRILGYYVSK